MTEAAPKFATYEDLCSMPEDTRAEIIAGTIINAPAPLPRHSWAQRALGSFIGRPFADDHERGGPGGWWIFVEVDVRLSPHDVLRPDLSGWRRERLPNPADQRPIDVVPDWVCEILSPSTATRDRVVKRRLYAAHQVPYFWLVDTESRTLEAFALRDGHWVLLDTFDEDSTAQIPPFEEAELEVGRLFLPRPAAL